MSGQAASMGTDNLWLWHKTEKTDPDHTKPFQRVGGFRGTSIKPYYLIRRATEVFGPIGIGWGFKEKKHLIRRGIWFSKVRLWYVVDGKRGKVEQWGATELVSQRKTGEFVDEEAAKKSVTDAVTKCLSYLGFGGDVHMGMFDDSKYVDDLKREALTEKKGKAAANGSVAPESNGHEEMSRDQVLDRKLQEARAAGVDPAQYGDKKQNVGKVQQIRKVDPHQEVMAKITDKFTGLEVFGWFKEQFVLILGKDKPDHGQKAYYDVLAEFSKALPEGQPPVTKANEFKNLGQMKRCACMMFDKLQELRAATEVFQQ